MLIKRRIEMVPMTGHNQLQQDGTSSKSQTLRRCVPALCASTSRKWIVLLSLVLGPAPIGFAGDSWAPVGGAPGAAASDTDDEWVAIPSVNSPAGDDSPTVTEPERDANAVQTNIGLNDGVVSLELRAAHDEPAEPLIIDFGDQGSTQTPPETSNRDQTPVSADAVVASAAAPVINLDMFVGQLLMLGKVDVTRVAIGNGSIVRAEVLKTGELLVIGQQEGSTSLRLWNKDEAKTQTAYNIRVGAKDPETRIRMERMVRLRVRMVEFNKRAIGKLGIDWGDSAAGPTFATAGDAVGNNLFRPATDGFGSLPNTVKPFSTYFGIATNITSKLNFLASNGDAVTLAEPILSAVNGGQASFLAGGEIPYPARGDNGQSTVEFKEYGVRLQVAPRIDAGGNVRTLVETEISKVDAAVSVNGTPGLLTRRAQTEVNVRSGETIVISGLLTSEESDETSGIPGLRHLPIIGGFFSSKSKVNEVRELVIFITPEVVEPEGLLSERDQTTYQQSTQRIESTRQSLPLMD